MALETRTWRRRPVTLAPLIDVIFLLLLFFMLSSTFTRFAEVPLMNAGRGAAEPGETLFLQLRAEDLTLNGAAMPLDALLPAIAELDPGDGAVVLVTLSGEVTSQRLVDLLSLLRGVPALAVSVLE
ncbi:MAG: biopolymer transporter ExbD [Roseicyclus sp.]